MPVYDYKCKEHGLFFELATMEGSREPANCPSCGQLAGRVILVPPRIQKMAREKKKAIEINEKNAFEPAVSSKERRLHDHEHSTSCGHKKPLNKPKAVFTARGEKAFPSMRPWMISH